MNSTSFSWVYIILTLALNVVCEVLYFPFYFKRRWNISLGLFWSKVWPRPCSSKFQGVYVVPYCMHWWCISAYEKLSIIVMPVWGPIKVKARAKSQTVTSDRYGGCVTDEWEGGQTMQLNLEYLQFSESCWIYQNHNAIVLLLHRKEQIWQLWTVWRL